MAFKILVVDDHPETRNIIARVLEQQGYRIITAESGVVALPLADKELPHLVLLDMMMPEMDGIETCRRMRAKPHLAKVPIIMFTAVDEVQQKMAGFEAGVDDYLIKPTEPVELIDRVSTMLESAYGEAPADSPDDEQPPSQVAPASARSYGATHTIAVLGARGGVGTTTVAINVAFSLAETQTPTLLVDLDILQGHVSLYLNQKIAASLHQLATVSNDELARQLPYGAIQYNPHLKLLLTTPDVTSRHTHFSGSQTAVLAQLLTKISPCVVVDCGCGVTATTRPILESADQIIVCLRPERIALLAAKQLLAHLREIIFPDTVLNALMTESASGINLPKGSVESYLGHTLWGLMPFHAQEMTQAVNKGLPLVKAFPQTKAAVLFQQLSQQLIKV